MGNLMPKLYLKKISRGIIQYIAGGKDKFFMPLYGSNKTKPYIYPKLNCLK